MNGFRTFLASLQFTDDRFEPGVAKPIESDPVEHEASAPDCDLKRAEGQQIAA